jgi:hypothetical protein
VKYHIANAAEPLKEGSDLYALCGDVVPKAAFKAFMDDVPEMLTALQMNLWGMCRKCRTLNVRERFIYVVVNGQEAMTAETI